MQRGLPVVREVCSCPWAPACAGAVEHWGQQAIDWPDIVPHMFRSPRLWRAGIIAKMQNLHTACDPTNADQAFLPPAPIAAHCQSEQLREHIRPEPDGHSAIEARLQGEIHDGEYRPGPQVRDKVGLIL